MEKVSSKKENSFGLLEDRIGRLATARFGEPTDIQNQVIPLVMQGRDVLAIAPTGFGKTESAFLPVLSRLLEAQEREKSSSGIRFLYITPLKALNRDMLERMKYWCKLTGVSLAVRHGDTTSTERVKQRDNPPQVLVTTPETLNSLLIGPLRNSLRNVRWVVIDEVHELVDSKRGTQLATAIERLKERVKETQAAGTSVSGKNLGVERQSAADEEKSANGEQKTVDGARKEAGVQVIGLSATVGSPEKVAKFVSSSAVAVKSELERKIDLKIEFPTKGEFDLNKLWKLDEQTSARVARIRELIETHESTLVFVNTRSLAESLASLLYQSEELKKIIGVHHGSLAKEARLLAEEKFKQKEKEGALKAIICTSSLELGIDVGKVNLVVQYHSPRQASRLLQRVGRSGHSKSKTPKGIVVAVSGLDCVESAVLAKHALEGKLEATEWEEKPYDILAHQIAGIVLDEEGKLTNGVRSGKYGADAAVEPVETKNAYETLKRALPYANLSPQEFLLVCRQLKNQKLLFVSEDYSKLSSTRATKMYYYENVSSIASSRKFFVKNAVDRKNVALLDEAFVAEYLSEGAVFITRGIPWRVLSVTDDEVVVEQSGDYSAAIPDWVGEEIPVSPQTAYAVQELLQHAGKESEGEKLLAEIEAIYHCSRDAASKIVAFATQQTKFFIPEKGKLFIEASARTVVLHTFAGSNANEALARVISSLAAERTRGSVYTRISAYSIVFDFAKPMDELKFAKLVEELQPNEVRKILMQALPGTAMFRKSFADCARRFGLLQRDADLRAINLKKLVETHANTPVWEEALKEILFEKLDADGAAECLRQTRKVERVFRQGFSPLAREFIEFGGWGEMLAPTQASSELLEAFKQNLLEKTSRLVCNYCNNTFTKVNKELDEKVKCPHCASSQLTLAEYVDALKKSAQAIELSAEERRQITQARRVESLIEAYGKNALIALSTYGVGAETAARMLGRLREDELEFYDDLLEAQKNFVKTRKFWKI